MTGNRKLPIAGLAILLSCLVLAGRNLAATSFGARESLAALSTITVSLNQTFSSNSAHTGDPITAQVVIGDIDVPAGTLAIGHVSQAVAAYGPHPGLLQFAFDKLVLPSGRIRVIRGVMANTNDAESRPQVASLWKKGIDSTAFFVPASSGVPKLVSAPGNVGADLIIGGEYGSLWKITQDIQSALTDLTVNKGTQFSVRVEESE